MAWRYTQAGKGYSRPSAEDGIDIDGPLTVEDLKVILGDLADVIAEQAKKEAQEE